MVWSLALRPDDAKQYPVVYGAEFGVVMEEGLYFTGVFQAHACHSLVTRYFMDRFFILCMRSIC